MVSLPSDRTPERAIVFDPPRDSSAYTGSGAIGSENARRREGGSAGANFGPTEPRGVLG